MEALIFIFALLIYYELHSRLARLEKRARVAEQKLSQLRIDLGLASKPDFEPSEQVKRLASNPKTKIAAMKAYREQTGAELREAKEIIEALAQRSPHSL
ncbi:hypothetical protein R6242_19920 [Iodobacter sp. CM08]|uniref:hypothetical protein n=1 Tax=Iodobacter sp. CM08 TaxID=3085902 RepID=UPI0029818E5E|nr:hypothetical protein [Iodobacter sp. CM08]MDW5418841.1 hypothetical protein [Iodobacter sp. CM08]